MLLRRPRNLLEDEARAYPPERIYKIITEGYGLMAPYRDMLDERERWAVANYVKALQLAGAGVPAAGLPAGVKEQLR